MVIWGLDDLFSNFANTFGPHKKAKLSHLRASPLAPHTNLGVSDSEEEDHEALTAEKRYSTDWEPYTENLEINFQEQRYLNVLSTKFALPD